MTSKSIRIRFAIRHDRRKRHYIAVSVLNSTKMFVTSDEMFARAKRKSCGAIEEEDDEFIFHGLNQLPLEFKPYKLATNRRGPGGNRNLFSSFDFVGFGWFRRWLSVKDPCDCNCLVICHDNDPLAKVGK